MVTLLDVSAVAGHHAMPAALLFLLKMLCKFSLGRSNKRTNYRTSVARTLMARLLRVFRTRSGVPNKNKKHSCGYYCIWDNFV